MTDTTGSPEPQSATPRRRGELTAWWIAFGVIVAAIVGMLGAWN